ncbi:MAG: molybdopterin molybdotransferase MoeA [Enterobacteriaceae bacterium]
MESCSSSVTMLTIVQAIEKILSAATPLQESECVPLTEAAGRITASATISPINVPPFNNSAMDGYAVRLADLASGEPLPLTATILAGAPLQAAWPAGSCLRIMTGAPVPAEADAVIMQEQALVEEDGIRFTHTPRAGQHIRLIGDDIRQGATVLAAGMLLTAAHLPLLASLGIGEVKVLRRLKVALFSTGDELQPVGQPLAEGHIYDTNRFAVKLMLQRMHCDVIDLGIIPDDPLALKNAFIQADQCADVVISSGGVSVGEADYTRQILQDVGQISFWRLSIKPGKPFAFGQLRRALFCGLPGNPVSAAVTFYQLVQPMLHKLAGHSHWQPPRRFQVRSADKLRTSPDRVDFQRGILRQNSDGEWQVWSTGHQGSHVFSSISEANCFIIVQPADTPINEGEWVTVEPFNGLLGE